MKNFKNDLIKLTTTKGSTFCTAFVGTTDVVVEFINKLAEQKPELNSVIEVFEVAKMPLEKLPEEVQSEVKNILKAFDTCTVVYEYGKFHASASSCIKSDYNFDYFVCGRYLASDVYTPEERRRNYIEVFG